MADDLRLPSSIPLTSPHRILHDAARTPPPTRSFARVCFRLCIIVFLLLFFRVLSSTPHLLSLHLHQAKADHGCNSFARPDSHLGQRPQHGQPYRPLRRYFWPEILLARDTFGRHKHYPNKFRDASFSYSRSVQGHLNHLKTKWRGDTWRALQQRCKLLARHGAREKFMCEYCEPEGCCACLICQMKQVPHCGIEFFP
jgi:hypothetical protein